MPNWFDRKYPQQRQRQQPQSRWSFSVEANVWVPQDENEEKEKQTAENVLRTTLKRVEGDASSYTAIDSNVQFDIQFEPLKR